jgi:hypothetical protein
MKKLSMMDENLPADSPPAEIQPIRLYTKRWFILALFSLDGLMTTLIMMSFSGIQNVVLKYYGLGSATWKVNLMPMSYIVCMGIYNLTKDL